MLRSWLTLFERKVSSGKALPEVDGLRFISIWWVVLFHANGYVATYAARRFAKPAQGWLYQVAERGHFGVHLFFVISGFVLALPFARAFVTGAAPPRLAAYFRRRALRIEPPYLVSLCLMAALELLFKHVPVTQLFAHLLASSMYLHGLIFGQVSNINGVAWSLEVEVQFYILAPWVCHGLWSLSRPARRTLLGVAILGIGFWQVGFPATEGRLALSLLPFTQYFLTGILVADLYTSRLHARPQRLGDLAALAGFVGLALVTSPFMAQQVRALLPVVAGVILWGLLFGDVARRLFQSRWLTSTGMMCYSIYLVHYSVISLIGRLSLRIPSPPSYSTALLMMLFLFVPGVLIVSGAFFLSVERPCMEPEWPSKLASWLRRRDTSATEPATRG